MLTRWQVYTPMEMAMVVAAISCALFLHSYNSHPTTGCAVGYGGTHMMNLDPENICFSCSIIITMTRLRRDRREQAAYPGQGVGVSTPREAQ
jgi:hypothetical protein